jgi:hypothetical protein
MNNSFNLSLNYINNSIGYQEPMRFYKGISEISFDLSECNTLLNPIVKIDINFNDGSDVVSKYYNFNYPDKITEIITNTFYPNVDTQNIIYNPTFFIKFLDGKDFVYQCPIKISKNSFYTDFLNMDIGGVQFIDNAENSLFLTLDTRIGDILNIKIK